MLCRTQACAYLARKSLVGRPTRGEHALRRRACSAAGSSKQVRLNVMFLDVVYKSEDMVKYIGQDMP